MYVGELREVSDAEAAADADEDDRSLSPFDNDTAEETLRKDLASEFCDLRLVTVSGARTDSRELTVREPEALGTE